MRLIERSGAFVEISLSYRELVALNNALALALVRADEQDLGILEGYSTADLKNLQRALSSIVPNNAGVFAEPQDETDSLGESTTFRVRFLRVDKPEAAVIQFGSSAALALANALTITRGWLGPGDAKTLLLCDDAELLSLLRDMRTIAGYPKRSARRQLGKH